MDERRSWHVAVVMNHCVVVFGGIKVGGSQSSLHVIWMYNLYTEQWDKHQIPDDHIVPPPTNCACAVVTGKDIFMFGGYARFGQVTNALWKLSWIPQGTLPGTPQGMPQGIPHGTPQGTTQRTPQGCFLWSQIGRCESKQKCPSPRMFHSGWEYAEKLWIFGGEGRYHDGFLNVHGDFTNGVTNQLLYFDPSSEEWQNPECFGDIPNPVHGHATAILRNKVWIFGGYEKHWKPDGFDYLYELDMNSLTWINIQTGEPRPLRRKYGSLTAATDTQLVLHGGLTNGDKGYVSDTWVFDIPSASWRTYTQTIENNFKKWGHTGTAGINNVIITGGFSLNSRNSHTTIRVMLAPKSLKQLAVQTIHQNKTVLVWEEVLPKSLCSLLHVL